MKTKKAYKNVREVAHAWAYAEPNQVGYTGRKTFSFDGGELFSYNAIIAKRVKTKKGEICLVNQTRYSNTTTRHQYIAATAFSGGREMQIAGAWENAKNGGYVFEPENIIKSYSGKLAHETENLAKAKRESTRLKFSRAIAEVAKHLKKLLEFEILKKKDLPADLKQLLKIKIDEAGLNSLKLAAQKKLNQKLKKERADILKSIENFRKFERGYISHSARQFSRGDLIRYNKENATIETSEGVVVPISEALSLYKLTKHHKTKGTGASYANKLVLDGKFTVQNIDAQGNAKVGCHFFTHKEIKRCYEEEYLKTKGNE